MSDLGPCNMCGNSWDWHQSHFARHPYTPPGARNELRDVTGDNKRTQTRSGPGIVHTTTPFDPVLRMVLIEKGIIGVDDLSAAEKKLGVVMGLVNNKLGENDGTADEPRKDAP